MSTQDHGSFEANAQSPHLIYDARLLTKERGEAKIVLDDKIYTLRITRQGKLILTK